MLISNQSISFSKILNVIEKTFATDYATKTQVEHVQIKNQEIETVSQVAKYIFKNIKPTYVCN